MTPARSPLQELADVIAEAGSRHIALQVAGDPEVRGVRRTEYQARAVADWLARPETVERIGDEIVAEITNRKGLRHAFDNCDSDIQDDIRDSLGRAAVAAVVGEDV